MCGCVGRKHKERGGGGYVSAMSKDKPAALAFYFHLPYIHTVVWSE